MFLVDSLKAFNIQRTESETLLKADKDIKIFRSRQDSNLRGETPLDFKSNALTTRPQLPWYITAIKNIVIEKKCGDAGDRTPGLSHAKRTLYH